MAEKYATYLCFACDQCGRMSGNVHAHPHDSGKPRYLKLACARCCTDCTDNPWRRNHHEPTPAGRGDAPAPKV